MRDPALHVKIEIVSQQQVLKIQGEHALHGEVAPAAVDNPPLIKTNPHNGLLPNNKHHLTQHPPFEYPLVPPGQA